MMHSFPDWPDVPARLHPVQSRSSARRDLVAGVIAMIAIIGLTVVVVLGMPR